MLAVEFRRRPNRDISSLPCLRVRSGRIGSALRWLKANNYLYCDVVIVKDRLPSLLEDGVPASWLSQREGLVPVTNKANQPQIGLEREWSIFAYFTFIYSLPAVRYIDPFNHFILAECFPCIFPDGLGPCGDYVVGDAAKLGWLHITPTLGLRTSLVFFS